MSWGNVPLLLFDNAGWGKIGRRAAFRAPNGDKEGLLAADAGASAMPRNEGNRSDCIVDGDSAKSSAWVGGAEDMGSAVTDCSGTIEVLRGEVISATSKSNDDANSKSRYGGCRNMVNLQHD